MKRGRPTKKLEARLAKIFELAKAGKTEEEISGIVGIGSRTLRHWKTEDWEFSATLKENKAMADQLVEASLFKSALGYDKVKKRISREGNEVEETEHYPPVPTSMIFWLKNRRPKRWRERVEVELSPPRKLIVQASDKQRLIDD